MEEQTSVISDQLFHTFMIVYMVTTTQGSTKVFAANDAQTLPHLIRAYDICPSISHLFADDVTSVVTLSVLTRA